MMNTGGRYLLTKIDLFSCEPEGDIFPDDNYHILMHNNELEKMVQVDNSRTGEAHLHDNVGDVVHVHHTAVPWQELFRTMGVKFPDEPVTGYRNGKEVPGIMNELIRPNDSVVIVVGSKTDVKPSDYVSRDRIRSVESRSENCAN